MNTIKSKRDIFRFNGEKPTAINLEHVTNIVLEGKRISFSFYTNVIFVDLDTPEAALSVFDQILNVWAHEVAPIVEPLIQQPQGEVVPDVVA